MKTQNNNGGASSATAVKYYVEVSKQPQYMLPNQYTKRVGATSSSHSVANETPPVQQKTVKKKPSKEVYSNMAQKISNIGSISILEKSLKDIMKQSSNQFLHKQSSNISSTSSQSAFQLIDENNNLQSNQQQQVQKIRKHSLVKPHFKQMPQTSMIAMDNKHGGILKPPQPQSLLNQISFKIQQQQHHASIDNRNDETIDLRMNQQDRNSSQQHRAESIKDYSYLKKPTIQHDILQYSQNRSSNPNNDQIRLKPYQLQSHSPDYFRSKTAIKDYQQAVPPPQPSNFLHHKNSISIELNNYGSKIADETKPPQIVLFSPFKPGSSISGTPQIQSKKQFKKRVQDVRELSVKKSLLAQDTMVQRYLLSSYENQRNSTIEASDSKSALIIAPNSLKDYQTRILVNHMNQIEASSQQVSVEKPRNTVNTHLTDIKQRRGLYNFRNESLTDSTEIMPFGKAPELVTIEPKTSQTDQKSFLQRMRTLFVMKDEPQNETLTTLSTIDEKGNSPQYSYKCSCQKIEQQPYMCSRVKKWLNTINQRDKTNKFDEKHFNKMRELYQELTKCEILSDYEDQIKKDLQRTFPKCLQFQNKQGLESLKRVLLAFSRYDQSIGYVQGMNFIVASLLHHCSEEIAFWIFVTLIEDYELRDIYETNLPGLYKHSNVITNLMESDLPDLHQHFLDHGILVEMYASDWVICLFASLIPLSLYPVFLDEFLSEGWPYFYSVCLSLLSNFKQKILNEDDISGILFHIKFKQSASPAKQQFVYDETSGQLVKQKEEQRLLSRWFNWSAGASNSETEGADEDKQQEKVWKCILEQAVKSKVEPARIQALRIQYQSNIMQKQ